MRMSKYLIILIMMFVIMLTGCGSTYEEATGQPSSEDFAEGYFTEVYKWGSMPEYRIVYANDTKVMYIIIGDSQYNSGMSPLYNSDGSLQIYEGE